MTTIHAYMGDQPPHDPMHKDAYGGRVAALSMIPTTTDAAKAVSKVLPEMEGRLDGVAVRVPIPNVSMVDLTATTKDAASVEAIQSPSKSKSQTELAGVRKLRESPERPLKTQIEAPP